MPLPEGQVSPRRARDQRLDFFRGLTMLIIFIAHTPGNSWNDWIPARFGFSSGTELFVFCSGCASAGAFGRVFKERNWFLASAKVYRRIWQIYWVQMGMVLACLTLAYYAQSFVGPEAFQRFAPLRDHGPEAVVALVQLAWLPDFLDILPMYIIILALLPAFEVLAHVHRHLPLLVSASLWACVQVSGLNFSGNPWTGDVWFLNPFAWQFCFMLGYSFALRRLPAPAWRQSHLMIAASAILFIGVLFSFQPLVDHFAGLKMIQGLLLPDVAKTNLVPVRLLHFLALAYVVLSLVTPFADRLNRGMGAPVVRIGQQSLATFVMSIVAAEIAGFILQFFGTGFFVTCVVNLCGFSVLLATALGMGFIKSEPWSRASAKGNNLSPGKPQRQDF